MIRYDRALLARGVLQQVALLELNAQGVCVDRLLLERVEQVTELFSAARLRRYSDSYLDVLKAKRSEAQREVLLDHRPSLQEMEKQIAARERSWRSKSSPPPPAAPMLGREEPRSPQTWGAQLPESPPPPPPEEVDDVGVKTVMEVQANQPEPIQTDIPRPRSKLADLLNDNDKISEEIDDDE